MLFTSHTDSSSSPSPMSTPRFFYSHHHARLPGPWIRSSPWCQTPLTSISRPPTAQSCPKHCSSMRFSCTELSALPTAFKGSSNLLSWAANVIDPPHQLRLSPSILQCGKAGPSRTSLPSEDLRSRIPFPPLQNQVITMPAPAYSQAVAKIQWDL